MRRKKGIVSVFSFLFFCFFAFTVACTVADDRVTEEKEMPLMENVNVNEMKSVAINGHRDQYVYSFEGNGIAIEDGVIYGLEAGTVTEVTVTDEDKSTTFSVMVHSALAGLNGRASAFVLENGSYVKNGSTYGESICMLNGEPLNKDGLVASGTLAFGATADGAEAHVFLRGKVSGVILSLKPTWGGYSATGITGEDTLALGEYSQQRANFLVFVSDGEAYYYLNDQLVWHTYAGPGVQLGFGCKNAKVTLSRLSFSYNEELVASLKSDAHKPFGKNVFGVRPNDAFSFVETGDGVYEKTSDGYHQQWLYSDANPVYGNYYSVEGKIKMMRPAQVGTREVEAVWQCCNAAGQLMRILLRYDVTTKNFFLFSDYETPNGFFGSRMVLESVSNEFEFKFEYDNGYTAFFMNGKQVFASDSSKIAGVGNLGATHFGFAGQRCHIVLSDMTVKGI